MGLKDLFITPFYILVFTLVAYFIRPILTTQENRKYFLPALWVRFFAAIGLGLLYQFYYGGGDTFNYWTHGSRWIWYAFLENPIYGFRLIFGSNGLNSELFRFSQHIWFYQDDASYFIVRLAGFFDLFTFHTYSSTALFFAFFSFMGLWVLFNVLSGKYPGFSRYFAFAILFMPSVVFWGSGILKDTITLGSLGFMTWALIEVFENKKRKLFYFIVIFLSAWIIYSIKIYILICYIPVAFLWYYWKSIRAIRSVVLRLLIAPIIIVVFVFSGYFSLQKITESNERYSLDQIAKRVQITAYDIAFWTGRDAGSTYNLGKLDGSWESMIKLSHKAVNVTLFRPYLWEVNSLLMLFASLESLLILFLTVFLLFNSRFRLPINDPFFIFSLFFALVFAFAVGVSTFNFGTLIRYKIPVTLFYSITLVYLYILRGNKAIHEKID